MWTVTHTGGRPPTMNEHRTLHYRERAKVDKAWRHAFAMLTLAAKVPTLERVDVVVTPLHANGRSPQDVAACAPAAKAAIDGLVDAGVMVDDGPAWLRRVIFEQPEVGGCDGLRLTIMEVQE